MKIDFDKMLDTANIASTAIALKSDFSLYLIFFFRLLYGVDFTFLPFHKRICEALESYVFGTNKKKNLVISMSPRSGKSVIMQFFITWGFIHNPKSNFIFTSYQEQVCNRTSDDILAIMRHPVWQKMFGVKLSSTTQAKELWETAAKGGFRSAPIESAITSFGCFDYDTLVESENGFEKIGKLVEEKPRGLKVWGMNERGERVLSEVVDYVYNKEDKYLRIEIEGGEVIEATTDHIFYTSEGLKRGYELRGGELLSSNIGTNSCNDRMPIKIGYRRIKSIVNIPKKPSYCLSVKNVNNFFITHSKILVHNCGVFGDEWGGCVVIDDALNPLFFNSEVKKRIVKESYETVFSKRLNNPTKTPIIIIMQRVAVDDLVGYVLEKYGNDFEEIKVPALDDTVNPPRSFWESQFPVEMLLKEQLANPAVFAAQRQQEPVLYNGNMFKAEWFKFYHYVPGTQYREVFMASDTAFRSSETADNTAIGLWGRTMDTNRLHLIDLLYGKISSEELVRKFMTFYRTWNGRVGNRQRITSVWIEDAASGMRLIEDLRRVGGIPVRRFKPRGRDKMMRVMDMKPMIESGNILFPENASHRVSQLVMKELLLLTEDGKAKHDDIADMIAQAAEVAYNRRGGF